MENARVFYIFMTAAVGITLYLLYLVFLPFLTPVLLGIIVSVVFHPVYIKILKMTKEKTALASFTTCLLIILIFILPLISLTIAFTREIAVGYGSLEELIRSGRYVDYLPFWDSSTFQVLQKKIGDYLEVHQIDLKGTLLAALKQVGSYSVQIMTGALKNVVIFVFNIFIMIFTSYYLFKDGEYSASEIRKLIPLTEPQKDRIFTRMKDIIYATIYGSITSASAQGLLGGMAFWLLGLPSPILWGVMMGVLALLPLLGAFVIWLPASLFLLVTGSYIKAIILILWGSLVISTIDNVIRPIMMSGRAMIHPLVTFFSIVGGLIAFGPIGLIAGPFVAGLFLILLDIIREVSSQGQKKEPVPISD